MKTDTGNITLYDLVACDRTSGRRKLVKREEPVRGRYQAQAELDRLQRANRDPNVQYSVEPRAQRNADQSQVIEAHNLLTHKFGRR